MAWVLLTACVLFASIPISLPCGISTHIAIGHQAIQWFDDQRGNTSYRQLILNHQDAFIAGNPYPDAMYSSFCFKGKFHSIAEDTHWTGFLNATVNYIRKKYPKPWSKETEMLVVFMLGFVSHQVADVTWHSLGIQQGFLQTMDKVNFLGSFPAAHNVGDIGGDMINTLEGDTQGVPLSLKEWYVPINELANIYTEYYGKEMIKPEEIETCTKILFLGWMGEKLVGSKLFKKYASKSPFLMEELHEYFQGGISDMAAWSGLVWHDVIHMIEHGTNTCYIPKSPLFIHCNITKTITTKSMETALRNPGTISFQNLLGNLDLSDVIVRKTEQGIRLSPGENIVHKISNHPLKEMKNRFFEVKKFGEIKSNRITEDSTFQSVLYSTKTPYAKLGWSMTTGNFDGSHDALVLGGPSYGIPGKSQYGRVYVVNVNKDGGLPLASLDLDSQAKTRLDGLAENGRFGTSLAVVDLNRDGVDDLAVSAPSTGANSLQYTGKVFVYYGIPRKGLPPKPDLTITGQGQYYNLGTTLMGNDIDNDGYKDLVVGSPYAPMGGPQRGSVSIFLAKTPRKTGKELTVLDADWTASGEQDFGWFGYSMEMISNGKKPLMVITAPTFRICAKPDCSFTSNDTQSAGRLYVYDVIPGTKPSPVVTVTGHGTFMKFGTSVALGRPIPKSNYVLAVSASTLSIQGKIVVSMTTFEQCGAIFLLNVTDLLLRKGDWSIAKLPVMTLFEGDRSYARFGWKVQWTDLNFDGVDDFVFSAPFRTYDITEEVKGAEEGQLYVYFGGKNFPTGKATRDCKLVEPCPGEKASFVFKSQEELSRFGTSFVAVHSSNSSVVNLVISSPRSSIKEFHSGATYIYSIKNTHNQSLHYSIYESNIQSTNPQNDMLKY